MDIIPHVIEKGFLEVQYYPELQQTLGTHSTNIVTQLSEYTHQEISASQIGLSKSAKCNMSGL